MANNISNTPPAKPVVNTTNTAPTSTGQSSEDVFETLMLLVAQGSGILQQVVQIQEEGAMRMNNDLDQLMNIMNKFNAEIPAGKDKNRVSLEVARYIFEHGMTSDSSIDKTPFIEQIKGYFKPPVGGRPLPKMDNGTGMVVKQVFDNMLTDKQTSIKKQTATLTDLSNMVNVKMTLLSSLVENEASAEGRVIDNFKPKQN